MWDIVTLTEAVKMRRQALVFLSEKKNFLLAEAVPSQNKDYSRGPDSHQIANVFRSCSRWKPSKENWQEWAGKVSTIANQSQPWRGKQNCLSSLRSHENSTPAADQTSSDVMLDASVIWKRIQFERKKSETVWKLGLTWRGQQFEHCFGSH